MKGGKGEWEKKRRRTKDAGRREEGMGEGENGRMGEWENFVLRVDRRLIFWKRRKAFVKL